MWYVVVVTQSGARAIAQKSNTSARAMQIRTESGAG